MAEFQNFTPEANRETHEEVKNTLADTIRRKSEDERE